MFKQVILSLKFTAAAFISLSITLGIGYTGYKVYNLIPTKHHIQIANNIHSSAFTKNSSDKYNPIVKLHLFLEEGEGYCSGTVLDATHLLTAAHCTPGLIVDKTYATDSTETTHVNITDYHSNFRADYSILIGDFAKFNVLPAVLESPVAVDLVGSVVATCGYPMGQKALACANARIVSPMDSSMLGVGEMYPGMSGGPVLVSIPLVGVIVVAVNTGTWGQGGLGSVAALVFSPLIGITAL